MRTALALITVILAASVAWASEQTVLSDRFDVSERYYEPDREVRVPQRHHERDWAEARCLLEEDRDRPALPVEAELPRIEFDRSTRDCALEQPEIEFDGGEYLTRALPPIEFDGTGQPAAEVRPPLESYGTGESRAKVLPPIEFDGPGPAAKVLRPRIAW